MSKELSPAEVAEMLRQAVPQGTPVATALIGVSAFVTAIVFKHYPQEVRKQQIVAFANMVWDMLKKVSAEQGTEVGEEEGFVVEQEEPKKEWTQ